ncbi:MAG: diguanylate cyclase [Eubacteriales bacterium]|nr:diguanylate cyclase [Eubacteriales bacterium]MDD3882368.1 diguanylate cyclase [Eubacteriales bacterium]MDD4512411.1 diguanylate cyclase [Eubacteriales bacterium]
MDNIMLIVDDSAMNREVLSLQFRDSFDIIEAADGTDAIRIIKDCGGNIDIVLLDLIMPEMNGIEVLKRRAEMDCFRDIPVVVITGSNAVEDQLQAFKLGASDYICKPFIPEMIKPRISNVLNSTMRQRNMSVSADELRIKAETDDMTGLYNKATTEQLMAGILAREEAKNHALLVIDIDNFKAVNDIYGHLLGDTTIRIIANAISGFFRKNDIVGRIGGDEFAVLMVNVPSIEIVRSKVSELISLMRFKPNITNPANVTLSVGYALSSWRHIRYSELFGYADTALYQAKNAGKARGQEYGAPISEGCPSAGKYILVLSADRGTVSMIEYQLGGHTEIRCLRSIAELDDFASRCDGEPLMSYIDVSAVAGDTSGFWAEVRESGVLGSSPVIAICREGELGQYSQAIAAGVKEIVTTPIDIGVLKRRAEHALEK